MPSVRTLMNMELLTQGVPFRGKQGVAANAVADWLLTSVTGTVHQRVTTLAENKVATLYDASQDDLPANWDILWFWADQDVFLQLIDINATGTHVVIKVAKTFPFVMSDGDLIAVANETILTITEPTDLRPIDKVVVGHYFGTAQTMNCVFAVID